MPLSQAFLTLVEGGEGASSLVRQRSEQSSILWPGVNDTARARMDCVVSSAD